MKRRKTLSLLSLQSRKVLRVSSDSRSVGISVSPYWIFRVFTVSHSLHVVSSLRVFSFSECSASIHRIWSRIHQQIAISPLVIRKSANSKSAFISSRLIFYDRISPASDPRTKSACYELRTALLLLLLLFTYFLQWRCTICVDWNEQIYRNAGWIDPRSTAHAPLTLKSFRVASLDRGSDLSVILRHWFHARTIARIDRLLPRWSLPWEIPLRFSSEG